MLLAVPLTMLAVAEYFKRPYVIDFRLFYLEGAAWLAHKPLYSGVNALNMNPPSLTVLLFAPLALIPYRAAQILWFVLSVAAVAGSLRTIARALRLSFEQTLQAAALLILMHGSLQAWAIGQLTWPVLLYPLTRAWVSYRDGRFGATGAWLAPAIVAKPPLALLALALPAGVWIPAGAISGSVTLATAAFTGLGPWRAWLHAGGQVNWLARPFNLSLWGVAARFTGPKARIGDLSIAWIAAVLLVGLAGWWLAGRERSADRRMFYAGLWSLLMSPLGWGYYLPLVAGPAVAIWPGSPTAVAAYILALLPVGGAPPGDPIADSLGFAGVLLAWYAAARRNAASPRSAARARFENGYAPVAD